LLLDAGTTTQQIVRYIASKNRLTVITNNLPIADEMARTSALETILLGGALKHRELCTVGPMVTQALSQLKVDMVFLSIAGFSLQDGLTDQDWREVEVKQAMMRAARKVILVADSSKLGLIHLVKVAPWSAVHAFISDNDLPKDALAEIESTGIQVLTPARMETCPPKTSG
jgi:DeoR/GlpR family transcriptional regulator of sugar metabolism